MRMRFVIGLALAAASASQAQTVNGLYVGAGIGGTMLNDTINRRAPTGFFGQGNGSSFSYGPGVVGQGAIGWGFGNGVRIELEGYYRRPNLETATLFANGSSSGGLVSRDGRAQIYGFMANAYYDFDLTALSPVFRYIQPFVGAGLGFAYSEYRGIRIDGFSRNRALSARRAQVVVSELVRQGISRNAISVSAVGGTGPVEAQSRRVDIILL